MPFKSARRARRSECDIKDALSAQSGFVWVHLTTNNEHAQDWLANTAKLDDYLVDALTATETRPRCEQFGDGALLNLRGRSDDELTSSDPLASVRIWAIERPGHLGHAQAAGRDRHGRAGGRRRARCSIRAT